MGAEALRLDASPRATASWYKIYALTPASQINGRFVPPSIIEETVAIFLDPAKAIAAYLALIADQEGLNRDDGVISNRRTTVCLSVLDAPDARKRGTVIYKSKLANKERGRIHAHERRLVLPAKRAYGELVERTWPWWPTWAEGLEACVERGDVSPEQADAVRARIAAAG